MSANMLKNIVAEYCAKIGTDPLLVQGAGGNVSWKDNDVLWVKASGTWLAEASEKDIFVPIRLPHLRDALAANNFLVTPQLQSESLLRPSIETLLHALMPQKVVVHLHAIEVLAHLVRINCQNNFKDLLDNSIPWALVEYHKPGAALAEAVKAALMHTPSAKIIFLQNHGVVIGGADVNEVNHILSNVALLALNNDIPNNSNTSIPPPTVIAQLTEQYTPISDAEIHNLTSNVNLFARLDSDWALYPDHVVFLGPKAYTYLTWDEFNEHNKTNIEFPELIFIKNKGVFARPSFNKTKLAQLRCYYDVLIRQNTEQKLSALTNLQIAELLNWDAEHYRKQLAK